MTRALLLAWIVAKKDVTLEFRSPGRTVATASFAALSAVLFAMALEGSAHPPEGVFGVAAWLIASIAAISGARRVFDQEEEDGAFRHALLAPVPRESLFFGKFLANLALLGCVVPAAFVLLGALMGLRGAGSIWQHALVIALGTAGLSAHSVLFGRISRESALGGALSPVLAFPLLTPLIYSGAAASVRIVQGRPWGEIAGHAKLVAAFALLAIAVGGWLFRYVVDE